MKLIITLLLSCLCVKGFTQATIYGPAFVEPGEVAQYDAYFASQPHPYSLIYWNVSGGTIISMSTNPTIMPVTIMIQWDNAPTIGSIDIYEDIGGQSGGASIQVGAPYITPAAQYVNFGAVAQYICVNLSGSVTNATFLWQQSTDNTNWTAISGATDQCYLPPTPVSAALPLYRCITTINGNQYISEPATVDISPLTAGTITLVQQPAYNSIPNISSTSPNGGFCLSSNYQYAWEVSVEGGPWTTIGTSAGYPSGVPIVGNTLIRRRIICSGQTLYSNTLDIKLAYTSVDYENRNYVRTYTVMTRGVQSVMQADQLEAGKKFQETAYFDGLGRTTQMVSKGVSVTSANAWVDLVSTRQYDNLGRSTLHYLPFPTAIEPGKFKTSTNDLLTYYSTNFSESFPWSKSEFESSPLNRLKKSMAVGSHRINNNIGMEFEEDFNDANGIAEKVHVWSISYQNGVLPVTTLTDVYQVGTLSKLVTKDQHGKRAIEYKDVQGNVILKKVQLKESGEGLTNEHSGWLCTYYVYDDFNRLRFIVTPKAVAYLDANNWVLTQDIADELCYYYEYDSRGRAVVQKEPGTGKSSVVYDQRDRIVFSQDGNEAAKSPKEWHYTSFDELGRSVMSGIYKSNKTAAQLQSEINSGSQVMNIVVIGPGEEELTLPSRPSSNAPSKYMATKSITLLPGFGSNSPSDEFSVEIGPVSIAQTISVVQNAIPQVDINNPAVFTAFTYVYYDQYDFAGVRAFDNTFTNHQAYASSDPDVEPIQKSVRTKNRITGSKVRILGTDNFLQTTLYYDENGALLQSLKDNYKNGFDVGTNQYHFSGRILSIATKHGSPGNNFNGFTILTKNVYDKIGRLQTLYKKYGGADFKKISELSYDQLGYLKSKKIGKGPESVDDPLETIDYSYNVNGALTGINKDYALTGNDVDQRNRYFGLYLGYENFDSRFVRGRFDDRITGLIWKTQGDNAPRMYDFVYDNADRLTAANFKQKDKPSASTWANSKFDFSESDILYDENGNIRQLFRRGAQPGNNSAIYIDKLAYTYKQVAGSEWSNQLIKVFDNNPDLGSANNGKLGDFKDEIFNVDANDYVYDANGNVVIDHNKKIRNGGGNGITYNFLDKPEKIVLENKSTVEYVYDASGMKLAKKVTPVSGTAKTTFYVSEFVYEDNDVRYLLHEEGRLRVMDQVSSTSPLGSSSMIINGNIALPGSKWGVFEYFLKDHLSSTRVVVTEEEHREIYRASMEDAAGTEEERIFGKVDANGNPAPANEVVLTRLDNTGGTVWSTNATARISKLVTIGGTTTRTIGPNVLLKVMSGDLLSATAKYFYEVPVGNVTNNNILSPIVSSLLGGLTSSGVAPVIKDGTASIQTILDNGTTSPLLPFLSSRPPAQVNRPKGYLNIVFFDENFNVIPDAGTAAIVKHNDNDDMVGLTEIQAPQNGYVYIYLSNESEVPVYFDDFQVAHERGAIVEESHYYAYGMKIAGISSRAFNKMATRYGLQGEFSEEDEETGWNNFDLRTYDPQTGRFLQQDPYDQFSSPYVGMGNNPVNQIDPTGGIGIDFGTVGQLTGSALLDRLIATTAGTLIGYGVDRLTGGEGRWGAVIGGAVGLGATYIPPFDIKAVTNWMRDWLPGIMAGPVAGITETLAGLAGSVGGLLQNSKANINKSLNNTLYGLLEVVGLREAVTEKWTKGATGGTLPTSLAENLVEVHKKLKAGYVDDPAKNGMHAWHAGSNAVLAQRLGPIGAIFVFLGGIYHETPLDKGSFKAEQDAQGTINHILDSFSDIIANGVGIVIGLILPKKAAKNVAIKVGNQIPGPGDPDPDGLGTGGYTGNPLDAWWQYPKLK